MVVFFDYCFDVKMSNTTELFTVFFKPRHSRHGIVVPIHTQSGYSNEVSIVVNCCKYSRLHDGTLSIQIAFTRSARC